MLEMIPIVAAIIAMTVVPARTAHGDANEHELATGPWAQALEGEIANIHRRFSGEIALYVSDPSRKVHHRSNVDKPTYLASGVKIAFMLEVFRQAERRTLSLDESLTYGIEDVRDGSPALARARIGATFTVRQLLEWMMHLSDNAASDMLAKRIGIDAINRGLREEGLRGFEPITLLIDVRRGVYREVDIRVDDLSAADIRAIRWTPVWEPQLAKLTDLVGRPPGTYQKKHLIDAFERYYATSVNSARLDAVGDLLERMARGDLVSQSASAAMLELMRGAKTSPRRMMGRLPLGTRAAHKTGSQWERICDLGIITLPDGDPLIFAGCVQGGRDRYGAEDAIARLARKAYDLAVSDRRALDKTTPGARSGATVPGPAR